MSAVEPIVAGLRRIRAITRARLLPLLTILAMVAGAGAASGLVSTSRTRAAAPTPASTSTLPAQPSSSVTEPPSTDTTVTTAPSTTQPPSTVAGLAPGAEGSEVQRLQQRLAELGYDPGPPDGRFGTATLYAVWAFQKVQGMPASGVVTPDVWAALEQPAPPPALVPDGGPDRVEIDLRTQLLTVYHGGVLRLVTHVSTGSRQPYCEDGYCGNAVTPAGSFRFLWRVKGWRTSHLGRLYNPVYFTWTGIAVHGATSVPNHPASHGCVRIPMHIAEYFPSLVGRGGAVYVLDGITSVGPAPAADTTTSTTTTEPAAASSTSSTAPSSTTTTAPSTSPSSSTSSTTSTSSTSSTTTTTTTTPAPPPGS